MSHRYGPTSAGTVLLDIGADTGALIFLTNDSLFTLPVALINVESGNYGAINYGLLLSGAVMAMIPCIVVYVALQRFYVRGLVSGALKG